MTEKDRPLSTAADVPEDEVPQAAGEVRDSRWRRILFGVFVAFAILFFVGAMLYRFGSMWPPSAATRAAYAELQTQGQAPVDEPSRFHIPVPGCVCHSDDPAVTVAHSQRRLSECMGCHGR